MFLFTNRLTYSAKVKPHLILSSACNKDLYGFTSLAIQPYDPPVESQTLFFNGEASNVTFL